MSQFGLTHSERITALQRLSYTTRDAGFLVLAALHGGFFLRRQYCRFIGKEVGGTAAALVEKLIVNRHASATEGCHNTKVYHLDSRPFYAALGQENNRNRRMRPPIVIKNKLMCLDVVLDFPEAQYLATEQEKVDYFTRTLGIATADLPTKDFLSPTASNPATRAFIDKFPISTTEKGSVSFFFVDEGAATCARFESYLKQYARLFAQLSRFEMIFAAPAPALFVPAQRAFDRLGSDRSSGIEGLDIDRLLTHFEDRRSYESGALESFDRTRLLRMRDDRQRFSGRAFDLLFEAWKNRGSDAVREALDRQKSMARPSRGTFKTHLLTYSYDIFGSTSRNHDAA